MAQDQELAPIGTASPDELSGIRIREIGYNGVSVISGQVFEEDDPNLRWPHCMWTYKKMLHNATIGPAVEIFTTAISSVPWSVKAPAGYEIELKEEVAFINSLMGDMKHSWLSFIKQASSYVYFGFAPVEIVPYYRLKSNGSKYNDGYIGIKKLALRSQDTITGWEYSKKGRDLTGVWQLVNKPQGKSINRPYEPVNSDGLKNEVLIPFEKILLFRNNPIKDNPEGTSPFKSIYKSWKYLNAYEENQAHGVAQDVHGLKTLYLPPNYMKADASPEDAAVYEAYKTIMRDIHIGQQSAIILPMVRDDIKGEKLFEFDIVNSTGQKSYDVGSIIEAYKKEILTALYADFLILGQSGGGSFALSESKMSVVQIVIRSKLEEIRDVLNHYLIPRIFKWNKWDTEVYPTFEFGEVSETTLSEFAKAWQQMSATNGIAKTAKNINAAAKKMGLPDMVPEDISQDDLERLLAGGNSKVGAGMTQGLGSGTGNATGSSGDGTASNSQNN